MRPEQTKKYEIPKKKETKNVQVTIIKNKESSSIKPYKCLLCAYKAKNKILLQYHTLDRHKTDKCVEWYTCSDCNYTTLKKSSYRVHMHRHASKDNLLYCANCPFSAKAKSGLISHVARHSLKAKYKCAYCSYGSDHQSAIYSHQWIHPEYTRNIIYQCIHCPYITRIKSHLERHEGVHTKMDINANIPLFRCEHCLFKCLHKSSLDRHNMGHERKSGAQCNQCSYTARNSVGLALHKKYHCHDNKSELELYVNKNYKCSTCSYQTDKSSHFSRHLATHDDSIRQIYKCVMCDFKCNSKLTLKIHFSSHSSSSGLQCSKCCFSSNSLAVLHSHLLDAHEEKFQPAKLFSCPNCSYKTIKRSDLNRHVTRHQKPSEINWVLCNDCPYKTKRKYQLAIHCKYHKINVGIKCCYCSFRSASAIISLNHVKLHL